MQAFCDERGEALTSEEAGERLSRELELDKEMRMYHRRSEIPRCPFLQMRKSSVVLLRFFARARTMIKKHDLFTATWETTLIMTRLCKHSRLCAFREAVLPGGCQLRIQ